MASAAGGAAQSFDMLVAARALQGAFGALLAPAALSLLTTTFTDPAERGKAFGVYGAIAGSGASIGLLLGGVLTEQLSWRWCMYVNLGFAAVAVAGALALLHNQAPAIRPKLDIPGALTASAGLFGLVYGFNHAETAGWGDPLTIGMLAAAVVLLSAFVLIQRRVSQPLLPLRVVTDRNRGASYLAVWISGIAIFGVFLFLTYYLQQNLGYTPIQTGLAFLPMTGVIMISAIISTTKLVPRFGPRPLVTGGMLLGATGMVLLTGLQLQSTYAADVLPALLVMGVGFGLIMAPSMSNATLGVRPADAGVASALVSASQQIGGSIGTALLSTIAASATTAFVQGKQPNPALAAQAAVHGYTTAFWVAAAVFAIGAVVCGTLFESGARQVAPGGAPVLAH